jgi:hypothetical protein
VEAENFGIFEHDCLISVIRAHNINSPWNQMRFQVSRGRDAPCENGIVATFQAAIDKLLMTIRKTSDVHVGEK